MNRFLAALNHLGKDESGLDLIEFAFTAAIVGAGAVVSLKSLDPNIMSSVQSVGSWISSHAHL